MDDYLPFALAIVLCINLFLFLGQSSITEIGAELAAPEGYFYNSSSSLICQMDSNNCVGGSYVLDDTDSINKFPTAEPIATGDGGFLTDMFSSMKNFFSQTLGLGYLVDILSAPKTFLVILGLPQSVAFAISSVWYLFTFFLLLAFLWGR